MLDVPNRPRLVEEATGSPDGLAVGKDLPLPSKVADQVEVQRRAVLAAEISEAHPEREVHRPPDLLVEEDVPREAIDLVVEPEGNLADAPGAFVYAEQRLQIRVSPGRFGGDHAPALDPEPHVVHLAPAVDGREAEPDRAVDPRLDRARVDLSVGNVVKPAGRPPGTPFDGHRQVRVLADDAKLAHRSELDSAGLELLADQIEIAASILSISRSSIGETKDTCSSEPCATRSSVRPLRSTAVNACAPRLIASRWRGTISGAATASASIRTTCSGFSSSE